MNFTWNIPVVGRLMGRVVTPDSESEQRLPLPLGAIAVAVAFAVWVVLAVGVVATLGELGPLITSLRAR